MIKEMLHGGSYLVPPESKEQLDKAMRECDAAYTKSVVNRTDYESLLDKIYSFAKCLIAFAEDTDECAGYVCMYANDHINYRAYITLICVKKVYQGKHIGSSLIRACYRMAINEGMKTIRLEVLCQDTRAIEFYQNMGFTIIDKTEHGTYYMEAPLHMM